MVRERAEAGDGVCSVVKTGRDGVGGATGSSKFKRLNSLAGAEVRANAIEERKIQRLFRNGEVTRLIKKSSTLGAGGKVCGDR